MENNEDQVWLDVLSGKSVKSANKRLVLDAKLLRASIQEYTAEEKAHELTLKKIKHSLHAQGFFESSSNKNFGSNSISILKKIKVIVVFALGLMAGAMMPMELARNSENFMFQLNRFSVSDELVGSEISLIANSPKSKTDEIVNMGISNNLEVKVRKNQKDGFTLTIYGLKRNNVDQVALKSLIGISNQSEGVVKIIISAD